MILKKLFMASMILAIGTQPLYGQTLHLTETQQVALKKNLKTAAKIGLHGAEIAAGALLFLYGIDVETTFELENSNSLEFDFGAKLSDKCSGLFSNTIYYRKNATLKEHFTQVVGFSHLYVAPLLIASHGVYGLSKEIYKLYKEIRNKKTTVQEIVTQ